MTKNIILGAVAALVLGPTAALAADLPVKAPPPVAIYDWTGFYIGVAGGGSLGTSDHIDPTTGLSVTLGYNITGGLVGGTLGYNWQVSSFVFGFEGDVSWVGEYGSISTWTGEFITEREPGLHRASPRKRGWRLRRGRFGYAVNNLLFYATGGYAAAGADVGVKDTATNAYPRFGVIHPQRLDGGRRHRVGIRAELVGQIRVALHEV